MPLNNDQLESVRLTTATQGWTEVMKPALMKRGQMAVKALVLTPSERAAEFKGSDFATDDDVLRAVIRDVEWMVTVWDNELAVANLNRQRDELDAATGSGPANPAQ
jgi:hypothetical protein